MEHIHLKLSAFQIVAKHKWCVKDIMEGDGELNYNLFLCEQDIHNLARKLAKENYWKDENDIKFVRMWVQKIKANVFFHQEFGI
jgi:hypothetical protein